MKEEERITLQEAADELGISEVTARRWVKSGKLKAFQPGRRYLIPRSAVERLLRPAEGPPSLDASDEEFDRMIAEAAEDQLAELKHELGEHLPKGGAPPLPVPTRLQLLAVHRSILIYREQKRRAEAGEEQLQEILQAAVNA
jgi:excisionase family DNA binding protein